MLLSQGLQCRGWVSQRAPARRTSRLVPVRALPDNQEGNSPAKPSGPGNGVPSEPEESAAVQLANNMAKQQKKQQQDSTPPPAVQMANNIAEQEGQTPPTPAVQFANQMAEQQRRQEPRNRGPASAPDRSNRTTTPADVLNEGIRAAANVAQEAIGRGAESAQEGIALTTNLTTQGITAAQNAADEAVKNLASAAEQTLTQGISTGEQILTGAATAASGAAGAVDGATSVARGSNTNRSSTSSTGNRRTGNGNGSATSTGSFDSVNVRVPGNMAWANATPSKAAIRDMTKTQDFDEEEVEEQKVKILAAVASLDRGLAANLREASEVDKLCKNLEEAAGPVTLKYSTSRSSPDASTMDKLAGTWRLIYSSGFNGGSLGGARPGPPAALVPTILGQVYQVIDGDKNLLDNVVELLLAYGAPNLSSVLPFLPRPDPQPTPGVRLRLRHTYEVAQPNTVTIVFETTTAKAIGPDILQGLPQFDVPSLPDALKPPKNMRSASFDVTYLDASMRITRGDRGELRIYLRDKPLQPTAPADYVD